MQETYVVSGSSILSTHESDEAIAADPRGIVFLWEEPKQWARYIVGMDPTVGITGWKRHLRNDGDAKVDNAAIEIFRVNALKMPILDREGKPEIDPQTKVPKFRYRDLQVAEYAAPIDAVEAAQVCNILGRIYAGEENDQAELIFESMPGPGILSNQELIRLGYRNVWMWERMADGMADPTNNIGWHSNMTSQRTLWTRSRRHLMLRQAKIVSPHLFAEYQNSVVDPVRMRAQAAYGFHDDRIQAANMAFWAAHKWEMEDERTYEPVTNTVTPIEWQYRAPTMGDDHGSWRDAASALVDSWE